MKNIIILALTILIGLNYSCSSNILTIHVDNSNTTELQNLNYEVILGDEKIINSVIRYEKKTPSYSVFEIRKNNEYVVSVIVNNEIIGSTTLKNDTNYLFISIFKDETGVFKVYFLESKDKIRHA